jgi:hypothetical protein
VVIIDRNDVCKVQNASSAVQIFVSYVHRELNIERFRVFNPTRVREAHGPVFGQVGSGGPRERWECSIASCVNCADSGGLKSVFGYMAWFFGKEGW